MTNHGVDEGMGSKMTQLLPSEEEVMLRREGGGRGKERARKRERGMTERTGVFSTR